MVVDERGCGLSAAAEVEMDGRTVDNRDIRRGRKLVARRSPPRVSGRGPRSEARGAEGENGRNGNHLPGVVEEGSTGSSRPPARAAAAGFGVNRKNLNPNKSDVTSRCG